MVQSDNDRVVNRLSAEEIYKKISSKDKKLLRIKSSRHGIVRGHELKEVAGEIIIFLDRIFGK